MKLLILFAIVALVCITNASAGKRTKPKRSPKGAYLLMVPRAMAKNSTNKVYLTLYGVDDSGDISLSLLKEKATSDSSGAEQDQKKKFETVFYEEYSIPESTSSTSLSFDLPDLEQYQNYKVRVNGGFDNGYEINGEVGVDIRSVNSKIIFIQTDKPFYKPGQKVMLRVLALNQNLKPLDLNTFAEVYIQQPNSARVAQWKNVDVGTGIQQFEMPLSDEPVMGMWTIYVAINDTTQSQTFEVKEYVLPKFEVDITLPPYTLATNKLVPITVCANYTYGKGVDGMLNLNISKQSYGWYDSEKKAVLKEKLKIKGCYKYWVNISLVDDDCCRTIQVSAEVVETGTDVSKRVSKSINREQTPLKMDFQTSSFDYVKPGLPYRGELKVSNPDDTPAKNEPMNVCMTVSREREIGDWFATQKKQFCKNVTSNEQGIVDYTVAPQTADIVKIDLVAKALAYPNSYSSKTLYQPDSYGSLRAWFSPSGSHIQIEKADKPFTCGAKKNIKILYTFEEEESFTLYYQVVGPNKVFKKKSVEIEPRKMNRQKSSYSNYPNILSVDAEEKQVIPSPDNKSPFNGGDCKALESSEYKPNIGSHSINLHITPSLSPSFTLIVYYVRKDREVVAASRDFEVEKCLKNKVTMKFGSDTKQPGKSTTLTLTASPYSQCGVRVVDKSVVIMDSSKQLTIDEVFNRLSANNIKQTYTQGHCGKDEKQPGLPEKMSSIILPPNPPISSSSSAYEDAYSAFETAGFSVISDLILLTRPCKTETYDSRPYPGRRGRTYRGKILSTPVGSSFSMRSAKLQSGNDDSDGTATVRTYFPDTWLFSIEKVGKDGILTTYQDLPDTITEWVGDTVCLDEKNGLGISNTARIRGFQPFFLSFTLPYSVVRGEKLPVIVSVFNYLQECLPITITLTKSDDFILLSDSEKTEVCVCGGETKAHRFFVQPKIIGQLNFTVSGASSTDSDVCGDAEISNKATRDALTNSIVVEAEGFPYEKVSSFFFFPKDENDGVFEKVIPYDLPEDLVQDSQRGFFSVTGDIMGPAIQNLDNLIQLPTGCGEQNIAKFLPIVYVLDYLTATGELKDVLKQKALSDLQQGYQSQMKYLRNDGSYSAFGSIDEQGSIFLTAFVVRAFSEASRYITIDKDNLQRSISWITSKQTKDGCFPVLGQTFSEEIKGGPLTNTTSSITAYILMSLLIADEVKDDMYDNAVSCIEVEENPTPYQNALFAYTFALADDLDKAETYLDNLFYTADESGDTTKWNYGPLTTQIQIAGYAVMTSILLDKPTKDILPIIRWMNSKRNSYGGFSSSQDTVTGLKAISKFAPLISTEVDLTISTSGILDQEFTITTDDRLLLKTEKVSEVPGKVTTQATGTGGGMIQATVRCNTNKPYQEEYFELSVKPEDEAGNCEYGNINVCTRYLPQGKGSNMALLEVKMASGVIPVKETLQKLQSQSSLKIQRFDVGDNKVVFYFDQLTNAKTCFSFAIQRIVKVENLKPATAKVYDYYAPEYKQEALYSLPECT